MTEACGVDILTLRHCEFIRPPSGVIWQPVGYSGLQLREKAGLKREQESAQDPPSHLPVRHRHLGAPQTV